MLCKAVLAYILALSHAKAVKKHFPYVVVLSVRIDLLCHYALVW